MVSLPSLTINSVWLSNASVAGTQQRYKLEFGLPRVVRVFFSQSIHPLLKTFWNGAKGWRDRQRPDGTIIWTSPTVVVEIMHCGAWS